MRKSINIILKKNILIILLMISMCPVPGFSYARFVINTDSYRSNEMYMAELLYTVKIDNVNTYTLSIPKGESEHIIEITSIAMIGSNYKLIYQDNSSVKIEYASDYQDPAFGGILTKRTIMLRFTNNTDVNQTLSFSVVGGYSFNLLEEIDIPSGYTEVNLSKGKTITGITNNSTYPITKITDGDITSANYATGGTGSKCIVLDLGNNYDLDEIAVWNYWSDGRIYNSNITYISSDNSNYIEVINRQEAETSQGKRVSAYSN